MTSTTYFTITPSSSHKPSRRKYPLTPPCVSPPALTTYSGRPDMNRSQTAPKATTLLSKVALKLPSRRGSPLPSPPGTPPQEKVSFEESSLEHRYETMYLEKDVRMERASVECGDYRRRGQQGGGYVSFPDFEQYCQRYEESSQPQQAEQSRQTART